MRDRTIVQFTFMLISQLVNYAGNIPNSPTSVDLRRPIHVATLQSDAYTMSVRAQAMRPKVISWGLCRSSNR